MEAATVKEEIDREPRDCVINNSSSSNSSNSSSRISPVNPSKDTNRATTSPNEGSSVKTRGSKGAKTSQKMPDTSDKAAAPLPTTSSSNSSPPAAAAPAKNTFTPVANGGSPATTAVNTGGSRAGGFSPHSTVNGGTPSPPYSAHLSDGLPPLASRQTIRMRRFLSSLVHFANDIAPEVGDRVRALIFSLLSGHLSTEEFHHSLQDVTNFPLRPFVLPFLRLHLPVLQREIAHCARLAKQTSLQYLKQHESSLFEGGYPIGEEIFHSEPNENGSNNSSGSSGGISSSIKRRASDSFYENGESGDYATTPKRPHLHHHHGSSSFFGLGGVAGIGVGVGVGVGVVGPPMPADAAPFHAGACSAFPANASSAYVMGARENEDRRLEEEWKNIHVMLNCILSMVEKTKRALSILQQRSSSAENDQQVPSWLRRPQPEGCSSSGPVEQDIKRHAGEIMAQTLRATEDRVAEVKRKAEEAVNEVKRQALVEIQRAEAKAVEVAAAERAKLEKLLLEARRHSTDESPQDTVESCWNCGRKAHETCSGCNLARYCGSFCQHKDWENHHQVCGRGGPPPSHHQIPRTHTSNPVHHSAPIHPLALDKNMSVVSGSRPSAASTPNSTSDTPAGTPTSNSGGNSDTGTK